MKKKLFIHIGRPKVASTAIQRFLKANRNALLQHGVLYPITGERQQASHRLCDVLAAETARKPGARRASEELYGQLHAEVQASAAGCAIVSSENFYLVKPKQLASRLADRFDARIVCYVRRQDEVLISSYIQELRDNTLSDTEARELDVYLSRPDRLRLLDYCHILDSWSAEFGVENIVVRVFEEGQLVGGDVYGDILDVLGLSPEQSFQMPERRVNSSPGTDVLHLIQSINAYPASQLIKTQLKSSLVEVSEHLPRDDRYDTRRMFSYQQRVAALARFEKSNAETARKYLGRKNDTLFREAIVQPRYEDEFIAMGEGFDPGRLAHIFLGVLVAQQREIVRISMHMERLKDALNPVPGGDPGGG